MSWLRRQTWSFRALITVVSALAFVGIVLTVQEIGFGLEMPGTDLLELMPNALMSLGFWTCSFVACLYGCLGFHQWHESRRILQYISSSERQVMSVLCRISGANPVVYSSKALMLIVGTLGLTAALLMGEPRWLGVVLMILGLRWWLWVRITTPPFVLFLSTSDAQSIGVHRQIKRLISPLRVVTLLDLENSPSSKTTNELLLDCLRTGNDDDWWKVITILIELAPLIVINADTESPGVVREALHLISEDVTFKTVFLTSSDGRLLKREPEPAASASSCLVVSANMLQSIIWTMLDCGKLPDKDHSVHDMAKIG